MNYSSLHKTTINVFYDKNLNPVNQIIIKHYGLGVERIYNIQEVEQAKVSIEDQFSKWDKKYKKILTETNSSKLKSYNIKKAIEYTIIANKLYQEISELLEYIYVFDNHKSWEDQKKVMRQRSSNYKSKLDNNLDNLTGPKKPQLINYPSKPNISDKKYKPDFDLIGYIVKSRFKDKALLQKRLYENDLKEWNEECVKIDRMNFNLMQQYENEKTIYNNNRRELINKYSQLEQKDKAGNRKRREQISSFNKRIAELRKGYESLQVKSICNYFSLIIDKANIPKNLQLKYEIIYNPQNKILLIEYTFPDKETFPIVREIKYVHTNRCFKEILYTSNQIDEIYDDALLRVALKIMYVICINDYSNSIEAVNFNGWVIYKDKSVGKPIQNCILSIQVDKNEFQKVNISMVDPKACFKKFKGISSSRLSSMTPIQPILYHNKKDKRFVDSYIVDIKDSTNIAAMDWRDFEHLIRELFEKEFKTNGGEVNVTRASRDGGVDAIAFDPDPIRGGKIVIQAKRYTNTVNVAAVRDLYGTVVNEGAIKGILVTTSDYGPDAYNFAKEKPITLINGSNLLYLLQKHGQKAKIDLQEAKKILSVDL